MKFAKYLLVLTIALCAIASVSNAQSIQVLGGGSSALFLELGQAAVNLNGGTGVACAMVAAAESGADWAAAAEVAIEALPECTSYCWRSAPSSPSPAVA